MRKTVNCGVLVVGAGHAGAALAAALRRRGYAGSILLASDEPHLPYERPPLSKASLLDAEPSSRLLQPEAFWTDPGIELALGCRVERIAIARHGAVLSDGRSIRYEWCVLATGARARQLTCPGATLDGTHVLRTLADAQRLRQALGSARNVVVIGAGYVGLEVAASARSMGKTVSVVEAQPRVLSRVTSPPVSEFFEAVHRRNGVALHLGKGVSALEGERRVRAVTLTDGTRLPADVVVVGIGIEAETALAEQAGIACHGGVLVDSHFRTSAPGVLAIGDCSRHPNDFAGGMWRLESVQHAQDSASGAALTILGQAQAYQDVPTFWSEQYDLRMQSAGIAKDADDMVIRGDIRQGPFSVVYLREGRMIAIDAVNNAREFMAARKLIHCRTTIDRAMVNDSSVSLKAFA
ncbi:FAD-dependent oxidoreductase [Novosphingobium flavum]|uniref:NAD(P)/FAD-dependent oxidoreductase n=1 Tax=Novosphingobium aerophilum TaxID=2839843 RepID=UPI00163A6961|nr:FAD-dependent oxidoreductase [Novosphingobium aerophilum]MBC2660169.1 FAD-dependent oxidoreductase [Novosphingobium aerophilum]